MDKTVAIKTELNAFCHEIGNNSNLVQGSGGNISFKHNDTLLIKASGTKLGDAKSKNIFVAVALSDLLSKLKKSQHDVTPKIIGHNRLRPSIETSMHAIMKQKVVLHIHQVDALAQLIQASNNLKSLVDASGRLKSLYVKYTNPGVDLANSIKLQLNDHDEINCLLLENHGIVLAADSIEDIRSLLTIFLKAAALNENKVKFLQQYPCDILCDDGELYTAINEKKLHSLALDRSLYKRVINDWAICPDHVVFLGEQANRFSNVKAVQRNLSFKLKPSLLFVENVGVYINQNFTSAQMDQLTCYYDVMVRIPKQDKVRCISKMDIDFLMTWDAEKHRQNLAKQ